MKIISKSTVKDLCFFVVLLAVMVISNWQFLLFEGPSEIHLWRQSDCISITEYYAKGNDFLSPEMHSRISDNGTSGKSVAEFPIVYYFIGKLWAIFGKQIWMFRLFNILLSVFALSCIYKMLNKHFDWFWSVSAPVLLLSSPIYAFYGIGFLTNITAFNLVIFAGCCFYKFYQSQSFKWLFFTMLIFSFCGLLKTSSLLSYFMILIVFSLEVVGVLKLKGKERLFSKNFLIPILLLIPIFVNVGWYVFFVEWYCNLHGGRYSFTQPVPVWEYAKQNRDFIWTRFTEFTMHQIYPFHLWIYFLLCFFITVLSFKKLNTFLTISLPLLLIGHICFSLLFYFCLDGHDYYHIDILIFFLLTYIVFIQYVTVTEVGLLRSRIVKVFYSFYLLYCVLGCSSNIHLRFYGCPPSELAYRQLFSTKIEIENFNYFSDEFKKKKSYYKVGKKFLELGFSDTIPVIAINDVSFNSLLLMMDRPGFTNISDVFSDSITTSQRIKQGAMLLTVEYAENENRGVKAFMGHKLFQIDHITAYDLRPYIAKVN